MNQQCGDSLFLVIPDAEHEAEYCRAMERWEALEDNIQPELMRRYFQNTVEFSYAKWLRNCEDDRTTGSMLSTGVPCTLHFLINGYGEILGAIIINHANTRRGHLHAGIVPWHRGKGYGTKMLGLALSRCQQMGLERVQITPRKDNAGAIRTIIRNGGVLLEEFSDGDVVSLRYEIDICGKITEY